MIIYYTSLISCFVAMFEAKVEYIKIIVSSPPHILPRASLILFFKKPIVTLIPSGVDASDLNNVL